MSVIWLVIGWRAMRVHERIGDAATYYVEQETKRLLKERSAGEA
jgi:hypothetical protein